MGGAGDIRWVQPDGHDVMNEALANLGDLGMISATDLSIWQNEQADLERPMPNGPLTHHDAHAAAIKWWDEIQTLFLKASVLHGKMRLGWTSDAEGGVRVVIAWLGHLPQVFGREANQALSILSLCRGEAGYFVGRERAQDTDATLRFFIECYGDGGG